MAAKSAYWSRGLAQELSPPPKKLEKNTPSIFRSPLVSYIDLNGDFSQFDRDNSDRFRTAAYNEAANRLAATVLASPGADRARDHLRAADRLLGWATSTFARHGYRAACTFAEGAYQHVVAAAKGAGVDAAGAATAMRAEADADRRTAAVHHPQEFVDSLAPDNPRSQP